MKLIELVGTKEYLDASTKVNAWNDRLIKADEKIAIKIIHEKALFFSRMKKNNPPLYSLFQVADKTLSESAYQKITGKRVIID